MSLTDEALNYHRYPRPGKWEIAPTKPLSTQHDLSLAYTPGVAEPSRAIAEDPDLSFLYTNRSNLVAVVTDGSAVLGLGNVGPEAGKPVMEGKSVLFKRFAGLDSVDLELRTSSPEDFINAVAALEPSFGGINLEDIKAPECFQIETTLRERMNIPVMHDDQHGTAIITAAALLNAAELTGRSLESIQVVVLGAGAAALSTVRYYLALGIDRENVVMFDKDGVLHRDSDRNQGVAREFATSRPLKDVESIERALRGADLLLGLSAANIVSSEWLRAMNPEPLLFVLANPDPEIDPDTARKVRPDAVIATGRSDHPNQVNNVLGFPFIFRGALDVSARAITEGMKMAATRALAALAREPVPETVSRVYRGDSLRFGRDYLIPKPLDPRLLTAVAPAVAQAAIDDGVARATPVNGKEPPLEIDRAAEATARFPAGGKMAIGSREPVHVSHSPPRISNQDESSAPAIRFDRPAYEAELLERVGLGQKLITGIIERARQNPATVAYPEATDYEVIKAASTAADQGIARPILIGPPEEIRSLIEQHHLEPLSHAPIYDPATDAHRREWYARALYARRQRRGVTLHEALHLMRDCDCFAAGMVAAGEAQAMVSGRTKAYPLVVRPALQIIGTSEAVQRVAGMYVVNTRRGTFFFADTTVNVDPDLDAFMDIIALTIERIRGFDIEPVVAVLSYSNFGSAPGEQANRMAKVVRQAAEQFPDVVMDGEIQANAALQPELLEQAYPFSSLVGHRVNTLIFPNLSSGNIAYKLLGELGGGELIGPILMGMHRPVQVLQMGAATREIVHMTALAVLDAQLSEGEEV